MLDLISVLGWYMFASLYLLLTLRRSKFYFNLWRSEAGKLASHKEKQLMLLPQKSHIALVSVIFTPKSLLKPQPYLGKKLR